MSEDYSFIGTIVEYSPKDSRDISFVGVIVEYSPIQALNTQNTILSISSEEINVLFVPKLIVENAYHDFSSDNVGLGINLIVLPSESLLTSDSVGVVYHPPVLKISDSFHEISSSEGILSLHQFLYPVDSEISISSDIENLIQHYILDVNDSAHALYSDNPTITIKFYIVVDNTLHEVSSESFSLTQHYKLSVEDALNEILSDTLSVKYNKSPILLVVSYLNKTIKKVSKL